MTWMGHQPPLWKPVPVNVFLIKLLAIYYFYFCSLKTDLVPVKLKKWKKERKKNTVKNVRTWKSKVSAPLSVHGQGPFPKQQGIVRKGGWDRNQIHQIMMAHGNVYFSVFDILYPVCMCKYLDVGESTECWLLESGQGCRPADDVASYCGESRG